MREFFDALTEQEKKFAARLATDNLGLFLRAAINELDWYSYNLARAEEPTFDQQEQFYLLHLGVTRLIKLTLDGRLSFDVPTMLFRRNRGIRCDDLNFQVALETESSEVTAFVQFNFSRNAIEKLPLEVFHRFSPFRSRRSQSWSAFQSNPFLVEAYRAFTLLNSLHFSKNPRSAT